MQHLDNELKEENMTAPEENPQYLQRKLYFILEQLQQMHQNLPAEYQMRIPYEMLAELANVLLNDTIFEIVKGLMEIQHVTEKQLFQQRLQASRKHDEEIIEALNNPSQTTAEKVKNIALIKLRHKNELKVTDVKTIIELDDKVEDQQSTLEKAGVPGFHVTKNATDIKVQMLLLDLILRISKMEMPNF